MAVPLERRALSLVGDVIGLLDLTELCEGLLRTVREAIPAEWSSLTEIPAEPPRTISLTDPPLPLERHVAFARYAEQNPIVNYFLRTRDGRATRLSELMTRRDLHRLELYREIYRPLGVEYQIAFTLPSGSERILGVALSRTRRDFTVTERDLLNLVRPYLIQTYRNAIAYDSPRPGKSPRLDVSDLRALGLTGRQAEVLRLVSMGQSNRDVASTLGISARTAQKHLEHCYKALNVSNRSAAAWAAWAAADD